MWFLGGKAYPVPLAGKILMIILFILLLDAILAYFGYSIFFGYILSI